MSCNIFNFSVNCSGIYAYLSIVSNR